MIIGLKNYGLHDRFIQEATMHDGLDIARVTQQHRELYKIVTEHGEINATVSGKFAHDAVSRAAFPVVGDWVMVKGDVIHAVLTRKSIIARQSAGTTGAEQAIAANIDYIFICMSLNQDFNIRRLERYLTICWDSAATPVIVLTKSDLCDDLAEKLAQAQAVSIGVDILTCSSVNGDGIDKIREYATPGKTITFIGSSGVGKSTLINGLTGQDIMVTKEVSAGNDKGSHATTHRQLIAISTGAVVIDTPGMREIKMHIGDASSTFSDIAELALMCKFRTCNHESEPGCAILQAIENGKLDQSRLSSFKKLERELAYSNLNSRQLENKKMKMFGMSYNEVKQFKRAVKNKQKR